MKAVRIVMGGPADLRMRSEPPVRLFTVDEANALVPRLESIFRAVDPKIARLRELQDLIEDGESYWGEGLAAAPEAEQRRHAELLEEQARLQRSLESDLSEIRRLGCEIKDIPRGLVDFPARIEGEVAYLCWQRGEPRVDWWHTLEGGFAGRRAVRKESER